MRHSNEFSTKSRRGQVYDNGNVDGLLINLSEDESAGVSSEEQSDILDFFVKDGGNAADVSVINLSDDDEVHDIPATKSNEGLSSKCKHLLANNTNKTGNVMVRKRGRPPKNKGPVFDSGGTSSNLGRTKSDFKPGPQSAILTPQRSLNCAIKFGEPVGLVSGTRREEKIIRLDDDDLDSDLAVLNRPKRSSTQKHNNSCSTDEENFNITWQEMRDLEKALAASLKRKDTASLDPNPSVQKKFVTSDPKPPSHMPKKRGRKRKEPIAAVPQEKAFTEDFINFLCIRPSSTRNHLPTSRELFMNCIRTEAKSGLVGAGGNVPSGSGEKDPGHPLGPKNEQ